MQVYKLSIYIKIDTCKFTDYQYKLKYYQFKQKYKNINQSRVNFKFYLKFTHTCKSTQIGARQTKTCRLFREEDRGTYQNI